MRPSRRLLAVPATVALVWALAACAGTAAPAGEEAGPTKTAAAPEATQSGTGEITAANLLETLTVAQKSAGSYDFTMSTSAEGQSIEASGSAVVTGDTQELAMTMTVPGAGDMEIRLVGGLMYMNMGEMTGGKFLQIDPSDASNPLAGSVGDITGELDPTKGITGQQAAITSVTKKGEPEQLDGVEAQPYEVVIDPSKLTGPEADQLTEAATAGVTLPDTFVYTFWIGPDGLMRKMSFDLLGTQTVMTFSNWANGAAVTAPTADQITTENPFGA